MLEGRGHVLVGERYDDEGEESGDRVSEVVPVDLKNAKKSQVNMYV
jgi:hypothetical protein